MSKPPLIPYADARRLLETRLQATEGEFAMWVMLGQGMTLYKKGRRPRKKLTAETYYKRWAVPGLRTFTDKRKPLRVDASTHRNDASRLPLAYFDVEDVERYEPEQWFGRFLSYDQLVERWRSSGLSENEIEKTIVALNEEAGVKKIRGFAADPEGKGESGCPPGTLFAFDPFARDEPFWPNDVRAGYFQEWQIKNVERGRSLGPPPTLTKLLASQPSRKAPRSNSLTAVIGMAKKATTDPDSYLEVWTQLVQLAQSKTRPTPLVGYAEEDGSVKYMDGATVKFLTKNALRSRFSRASKRT